jgi:hypothetical protein
MNLKRDSRLVRWAFLDDFNIPYSVSLCVLFWRVVLRVSVGMLAISLLGLFIYELLTNPMMRLGLGVTLGIVILIGGSAALVIRIQESSIRVTVKNSWIGQYAKARKEKICPIITLN